MNTMKTVEMLDKLAELRAGFDSLRLNKDGAIGDLLTIEQKNQIDEIEAEYYESVAELHEQIDALEDKIKEACLEKGETIKGSHLMAVWNKPRVSWDSRLLDGYAVAHPEILQARKEGEPTVSIRAKGS